MGSLSWHASAHLFLLLCSRSSLRYLELAVMGTYTMEISQHCKVDSLFPGELPIKYLPACQLAQTLVFPGFFPGRVPIASYHSWKHYYSSFINKKQKTKKQKIFLLKYNALPFLKCFLCWKGTVLHCWLMNSQILHIKYIRVNRKAP